MSTLTDDELLLMFREGDPDAFDVLFDRHHAAVYNFARVALNGTGGAEDVMQDAFLAVARAAKQYRPRGLFRPWLMRITRNLCLDRLRARRAREAALGPQEALLFEPPDRAPQPDPVADGEQEALLRSAICSLPPRQREALALYAFERMTYAEVAQTLEVPVGTVKTLIHRARAALARRLEDEGHDL